MNVFNSDPDLQPPFLSWGFRPFFLLAGAYTVASMSAWLAWLLMGGVVGAPRFEAFAIAPEAWHAHEMIFGYAAAVLSGFMLTAVPNWTGARRIAGGPLILLAAVWLAGRLAMWFAASLPPWLVAATDLLHLPLLAGFIAAGLMVRPAPRNLVFLVFIALLVIANAAFHAEALALTAATASPALASALLLICLMVAVIGGRIVPSFTRNALIRTETDPAKLPRSLPTVEKAALGSTALLVPLTAFDGAPVLVGGVALVAAAAHAVRLSYWRGQDTLRSPILWSLHLFYGFLVLGFGALAVTNLGGNLPVSASLHLLGVGAIGGMTLAVMTRAALGHTGRPLKVARPIAAAYGLIAAAALIRACGPTLAPDHSQAMLAVAALLWITAFGLFMLRYTPILVGPSAKT